jgi:SAM-dependent methyltransferase
MNDASTTHRPAWPAELSTEEILARMSYVGDAVDVSSAEGRMLKRTITRGILHLVWRNLIRRIKAGSGKRSAEYVSDLYQGSYAESFDETKVTRMFKSFETLGRTNLYRINGETIVRSDTRDFVRFNAYRLRDAVSALQPSSVCEIGFGSGNKLLYLANQFPEIACSGYELTEAGTTLARRLQAMDDLPTTPYGSYFGFDAAGMDNVRRVALNVGSAFDLPCEDNAYDLVYTSSALEQMQDGLPRALSEIRRVSRRHVLMFEPFGDFNDRLGQVYLWSVDYFRMRSAELEKHGLRPVATWHNYPIKPTFAFGMVLAEVV